MLVDLTELNSLLEVLKGGASTKNNSFDLLYFSKNRISTFNDETAVSVDFNSDFTLLVPFSEFANAVRKLVKTENNAEMVLLNEKTLMLKVNRAKFAFNLVQDDTTADRFNIPNEQLDQVQWADLPDNFDDIITAAAACVSTNRQQYMLTCVHFERHDIFGADLTAAYWAEVPENLETMAITAKNIRSIAQVNPDKYACTKSFYHFKNTAYNCILSVRKVVGTYPDYKKFFDVKGAEVSYVQIEALRALDMSSTMLAKEAMIKVTTKQSTRDKYMFLEGNGTKGSARAKFPVQIDSDVLPSFSAPPAVLKRCFEQASTFTLSDTVLKCETDTGSYIISLTKD